MSDKWMPVIKLPLKIEQFRQLPRNAAYRYEYFNQAACLSPRPLHYHALLELKPITGAGRADIRPIKREEILKLAPLFAASFRYIQPYGCLDDANRLEASREALERTSTGGDGPIIDQASFQARRGKDVIGAALLTLLPDGDPCTFDSYEWKTPPPADCIARRLGRPHLTWIFVAPTQAGHGIGTALLAAVVRELMALGYTELLSTFMIGNDSSMLWHWRNGFRLLAYPGSRRLLQERVVTESARPSEAKG